MAFEERATLTGIARNLKETFEGFGDSKHQEEVKLFRKLYGDAECIRIGEMDYIVINEVYKSKEYEGVPENISPLFFNSIKNDYAIIDAETSSTLIDEVYSRVTYMQRICTNALPGTDEILKTMNALVGEGEKSRKVDLIRDDDETQGGEADMFHGGNRSGKRVNIFQCQLVKDTGVSASPDTYSFMMKDGKISEIASHVMRQIRGTGQIKLLKDNEILEGSRTAIQQAVFDKYIDDDLDIQSITVKSIFEININFVDFFLELNSNGNRGFYQGSHLAGENNEFEALNASIHGCNQCGRELVDVKDSNNVHRLHINMDALLSAETLKKSGATEAIHAVGCEECLEQCPSCGGWHFNYAKLESAWLKNVQLAPGREFISGLSDTESGTNYCACREWIEWVHDEKSGSNGAHGVIPIAKLAFINSAREKLASYEDFKAYCDKKRGNKQLSAQEEAEHAKKWCVEFKKRLAARFDIDVLDITVTSSDKCNTCAVCGGEYYADDQAVMSGQVYRCNVCEELDAGNRSTVTRIDGVVFMCRKVKKKKIISKYIVTKLGNLKRISSMVIDEQKLLEEAEAEEAVSNLNDEGFEDVVQGDEV